MTQPDGGIGNLTPKAALVEMAMSYARSRMLCAAARLGVADVLKDEVCSVDCLAESCHADADALYLLLASWSGPLRRFNLAHPWNVEVSRVVFGSAGA
jgi:hypothetical protein